MFGRPLSPGEGRQGIMDRAMSHEPVVDQTAVIQETPPPERRPFQFTLRQLFKWVTVVAIVCSVVAVGMKVFETAQEKTCKLNCQGNLRHIYLNLRRWDESNGSMPSAHTVDANGKRMQSWRLASIAHEHFPFWDMYRDQQRRDEPWDSPYHANLTAKFQFPCCPLHQAKSPRPATYVAVIGPNTMWPGATPSKLSWAVSDDTLLMTEIPDLGIHWAEPRDITVDEFVAIVRDLEMHPEKRPHRDGLHYVTVGGDVRTLPYDTPESELRELVRAVPKP